MSMYIYIHICRTKIHKCLVFQGAASAPRSHAPWLSIPCRSVPSHSIPSSPIPSGPSTFYPSPSQGTKTANDTEKINKRYDVFEVLVFWSFGRLPGSYRQLSTCRTDLGGEIWFPDRSSQPIMDSKYGFYTQSVQSTAILSLSPKNDEKG